MGEVSLSRIYAIWPKRAVLWAALGFALIVLGFPLGSLAAGARPSPKSPAPAPGKGSASANGGGSMVPPPVITPGSPNSAPSAKSTAAAPAPISAAPISSDPVEGYFDKLKAGDPRAPYNVSNYYDAADEVLSQQGFFNIYRLRYLEAEIKNGSPNIDQTVQKMLPGFCLQGEKAQPCFDRFKIADGRLALEIKASLEQNRANRDALAGDHAILDSEAPKGFIPPAPPGAGNRLPLTLSLEDLNSIYQRPDVRQFRTQAQYKAWLEDLASAAPKREEFHVYEVVPRFPGTASNEVIHRVRTNPDGSPYVDEAKFAAASKQFKADQSKLAQDVVTLKNVTISPPPSIDKTNLNSDTDLQIYRAARSDLIEQANGKAPGAAPPVRAPANQRGAPTSKTAEVDATTGQSEGGLSLKQRVESPAAQLDAKNLNPLNTSGSDRQTYRVNLDSKELDLRINEYIPGN